MLLDFVTLQLKKNAENINDALYVVRAGDERWQIGVDLIVYRRGEK